MNEGPRIAIFFAAVLFLVAVASAARAIGADIAPMFKAALISLGILLVVGFIWWSQYVSNYGGTTNWSAYGVGFLAADWWAWWPVLDSIAINKEREPVQRSVLGGFLGRTSTSPFDTPFDPLVPDVFYTSSFFKWGVEVALIALVVFLIMRSFRRGY